MDNKGIITTFAKYVLFFVAAAMMAALVIFFPDVANNSALWFQTILAAFLGVDIATTLKTTNALPEGQFKLIKKGRYIATFIINGALFTLATIMGDKLKVDMTPSVTVFSSGCFLVIAMFLGAIEGSKLLAYGDPSKKGEIPSVGVK